MASIPKRGTTIIHANQPAVTGSNPLLTQGRDGALSKELLPISPLHLDPKEVDSPERIVQVLMGMHEDVRRGTLPNRQDPECAPCYVRGVVFDNGGGAGAATKTVTFQHALNRVPTILYPVNATGGLMLGWGLVTADSNRVTVSVSVSSGAKLSVDFKLAAD